MGGSLAQAASESAARSALMVLSRDTNMESPEVVRA
jgi:hypothetical protein